MDGIDWMTVAEFVPITAGLVIFGLMGARPRDATFVAVALFGAIIGFAPFNRPVARLFLGDVGSLPIGLILGWMLILLAGNGHLAGALLLPLYYLADATITLAGRITRGVPITRPSRPLLSARRRRLRHLSDCRYRIHAQCCTCCAGGNFNLERRGSIPDRCSGDRRRPGWRGPLDIQFRQRLVLAALTPRNTFSEWSSVDANGVTRLDFKRREFTGASQSGRLSTDGLRSYFFYKGRIEDFLKPREGSGHSRTVYHSVVVYNSHGYFAFAAYHAVVQGCRQRCQRMQQFSLQRGINRYGESTEEV